MRVVFLKISNLLNRNNKQVHAKQVHAALKKIVAEYDEVILVPERDENLQDLGNAFAQAMKLQAPPENKQNEVEVIKGFEDDTLLNVLGGYNHEVDFLLEEAHKKGDTIEFTYFVSRISDTISILEDQNLSPQDKPRFFHLNEAGNY